MNACRRFLQSRACFISVAALAAVTVSVALLTQPGKQEAKPASNPKGADAGDHMGNADAHSIHSPEPPKAAATVIANPPIAKPGADPPSPTHEEIWRARQLQRLQAAIEADIAAGLNADVRQREAKWRQAAGELVAGMRQDSVLRVLGPPSSVRELRGDGTLLGSLTMQTNGQGAAVYVPAPVESVIFQYSPRDDETFDGRNGWGYQILFVHFDSTGQWLARWQWEPQQIVWRDERRQWQKWEDYAQTVKPAP